MIQAIGYVRCSTREQAISGLGLDSQRETITQYCKLKSLALCDIIEDAGESGSIPIFGRPGGARLRKIPNGTAIVIVKLDRGFRNAADCLTTVEQWTKRGVVLHIIDLGGNSIDVSTACGTFILTVLAGAAQMERGLTCERTKSAMQSLHRNGKRAGALPYGWDVGEDGETLEQNPTEQRWLTEMQRQRYLNRSYAAIAISLNACDVPTKAQKDAWDASSVRSILRRAERLKPGGGLNDLACVGREPNEPPGSIVEATR